MPLSPLDPSSAISGLMATSLPSSESTGGALGSSGKLPDAGHQHPRLTSTTLATVVTGSTVKVAFTRNFTKQPGITCTLIESGTTQPVIFVVDDWLAADGSTSLGINPANGTVIGGVQIKALRSTTIPQNLVTLLASAVYNLFGGTVTGVTFSCIAVARSD